MTPLSLNASVCKDHHAGDEFQQAWRHRVCDQKCRATFHERLQCRVDGVFALGVDCAGRFVKKQKCRISEDRAGECNSLPLSAGQVVPFHADLGRESVRQTVEELGD